MNVGNADETDALIVGGASRFLLGVCGDTPFGGGSIVGRFTDGDDGSTLLDEARAVGVATPRLLFVFRLTFGCDDDS